MSLKSLANFTLFTLLLHYCVVANVNKMQDSLNALEKVIVTATRIKANVNTTPSVAYVVDKKEIEKVSANRSSDVLDYVPGIDVEAGTGVGIPTKKTVSLNGLPSFHTVVLVDGKRLLSSHFHTGADVDLVPAGNIERIEVIKDASSALYGSDALGGVINIITKKGTAQGIGNVNFEIGTQNSYKASTNVSGISGIVLHNTFLAWDQSDGLPIEPINWQTKKPSTRAGKLNFKQFTLMENFEIPVGSIGSVNASVHYVDMKDLIAGTSAYDAFLFTPGLNFDLKLHDHWNLSGLLYYSRWNAAMAVLEQHEYSAPQLWARYSGLKNNNLTFGIEGSWRKLEREGVLPKAQKIASLFLQDEMSIIEMLRIQLALRSDYVLNKDAGGDNIGPVLSPKLSLLFKPINIVSLRLGTGYGFRAPHVQDLYESRYHPTDNGIWRYGNPDLKPEYSFNILSGVDITPLKGLTIRANAYRSALDNMVLVVNKNRDTTIILKTKKTGKDSSAIVPVRQRENISNNLIKSAEIDIGYNYRFLEVHLGGTGTWQYCDDPIGRVALVYPGHNVYSKVNINLPVWRDAEFNTFVNMKYCFDRKSPGGKSMNDYINGQFGLGLSYLDKYKISCRIENLFSEEIDVYEDALYTIQDVIRYEIGFSMSAF